MNIIEQNGYKLLMCSDKLAQGVINTQDPNDVASPFCKFCVDEINSLDRASKVLMLGLGTGTIPNHSPDTIIMDIVEINPQMLDIAADEFGYEPKWAHFFYFKDAIEFVKDAVREGEAKYSLVIVDIFDGEKVPEIFRTKQFYNLLSNLTDKVIVNEISGTEEDPNFNYGDRWTIITESIPSEVYWSITKLAKKY